MTSNKSLLVLAALFLLMLMPSQAQYHLRNGDMSEWSNLGANAEHARYWNSMKNGTTGGLAIFAPRVLWQSTDVPPVPGITYSAMMKATSTAGIIANGQMTTGCVNAGSMAPNTPNSNYNYTRRGGSYPEFNTPIIGTPDSIRFWAKCVNASLTDSARVSAVIHDDYNYHDPEGTEGSDAHWIGKATLHFNRTGGADGTWVEYSAPFVYNGPSTLPHAYILVTFTTNKTPGGGAGGDLLYVTDVKLIYSSWLADLKMGGVTVDGFEKGIFDYAGPKLLGDPPYAFPYQPEDFTYTLEASDATVLVTNVPGPGGDAEGGYTSVLITAEDGNTHEYKVHYHANRSADNDLSALGYTLSGDDTLYVPGFTSSTLNYAITFTDPEEVRIPQINHPELSDPTATILRINQPTNINSMGSVTVQAENYALKTYTISFSKVVSSNSKLSGIKIGGVDLADFDTDVQEYDHAITTCVSSALPIVSVTTTSAWATFSITQASLTSKTATIVVTAEDGTQTTYTINFTLANNDAALTGYRVGSSTQSNVFSPTNFEHTYSYSLSAVPSLSVPSAQQSCGGSTVEISSPVVFYPDTNYITVTAQDGITSQIYKSVIKNTNCYLTTGANNALRYNYNGATDQNTGINITTTHNGNLDTVITSVVTLPVGPNVAPELVVYGLAAGVAAPPTVTLIQPAHRNDTATVTLTANNGIAQKTYKVPFKATLSADATLSSITYNGNPIMGFTPDIEKYTVVLPSSGASVPEIAAIPGFQYLSGDNITITPAISLLDTTKITVTAENGIATKTYAVAFDVEDLFIEAIQYDNITIPGYNPTVYTYTVDIPYSTTTPPQLSAISNVETATILYAQPTTLPYQGKVYLLSEGMTVIKIYTIDFRLVKNTDATLADLKVNGVSLQDFNPQQFLYEVELPYTELDAPVVAATPAYSYSQVNITQIDTVQGSVTIAVTAEDDDYTNTYTIHFTRESSPVTALDTIKFEYDNQSYAYEVTEDETEITIMLPAETEGIPSISEIVLADYRADYLIIEQPDETNSLTGTVTVTAEDLTEETYHIAFEKTLSGSTLLANIYYNGIAIPDFDPLTTTYNVILPWDASQIPVVAATPEWANTDVQITQPTQVFGQAQILVISENGQNNATYTINFQRKGNVNIVSLSYNLDTEEYPISDFDPFIHEYSVTLPIGTTVIPELNYELVDQRTEADYIPATTPNGDAQLILTTWNQDTTLTYTVHFTVELSTNPDLSGIYLDGELVDGFDADVYFYTHESAFGTTDIPVITATAVAVDARIDIQQAASFGDTAHIICYAGDETYYKHYKMLLTVDSGNNVYLSDLSVNDVPVAQFDKNQYLYEVSLPYGTTQLPEVSATAEDSRSVVTIKQVLQFEDTAKVKVTAINGDTTEYRVSFIIEKNSNAYASDIFIDGVRLESFDRNTQNYDYYLPMDYVGIPEVEVELEDANATYAVVDAIEIPGQTVIEVTAENGTDILVYRINFSKGSAIVSWENRPTIQVYPNPCSDNLHFLVNGTSQASKLEIYSLDGRVITRSILQEGTNSINVESLPQSMYYYKVFTDKEILESGKFVKH